MKKYEGQARSARRGDVCGANRYHGHMADMIIGVGGHARSGKRSLAEALATRLGLPLARFSREVERVARERGLPLDPPDVRRTTLTAVGKELVGSDPEPFCRRVLAQAGWPETRSVIVEGVRHARVADTSTASSRHQRSVWFSSTHHRMCGRLGSR